MANSSGEATTTGAVFRSAQLGSASAEELQSIGVSTVIDLRTDVERNSRPSAVPPGARIVVADVFVNQQRSTAAQFAQALQDPVFAAEFFTSGSAEREVQSAYRLFVTEEGSQKAFRTIVETVANADGPVLFHCTAGKDRTGWAATVLLAIAGVPQQTLLDHYLSVIPATDELFQPIYQAAAERGLPREWLHPVLRVQPSFFQTAIDAIVQEFGGFQEYLRHGLDIDADTANAVRGVLLAGQK
ncbi:tyrosine-protein phosphatase [Hoyosella rhizosphaerae]|uniref:tyrosine-protein phosphatase n=1 Tax=Hoyosella rhizosphaerae TaxID=1755582 RepID=UPI001E2FD3D0|nr:tyrosine-protein phosphatase [Hoyosella rhizosphaerae]